MNFERRDFLRLGTAGLTSVLALEPAFGQRADKDRDARSNTVAELKSANGSLAVKLKLDKAKPPGTLEMQFDEFSIGKDTAMIAQGTFSPLSGAQMKLYRSFFSTDNARQVFARLGDDDHWTSLLLASTENPHVESLAVWNDNKDPETFRINKEKFADGAKPQEYILDNRGGSLDLNGTRKPPDITMEDLENALDDNSDYLVFRRGKIMHHHAVKREFPCTYIVIAVPGGGIIQVGWNA
ncbi:MAG TPA: hypothetical protein VEV41_21820 [Terriglobales bacterium]|nr:hypothetical protein [Terriglobales bacterium]